MFNTIILKVVEFWQMGYWKVLIKSNHYFTVEIALCKNRTYSTSKAIVKMKKYLLIKKLIQVHPFACVSDFL